MSKHTKCYPFRVQYYGNDFIGLSKENTSFRKRKTKKGKESSTITRNVIFHNCTMYIFPTIIVIYVIRFFTMVHNEYPLCVATIVTNLTSNCLSLVMYTMCLWCVFLVAILWNWSNRIWFSCIECRQNNSCTFPLTMKKNSTNSFPHVRNSNNTHREKERHIRSCRQVRAVRL